MEYAFCYIHWIHWQSKKKNAVAQAHFLLSQVQFSLSFHGDIGCCWFFLVFRFLFDFYFHRKYSFTLSAYMCMWLRTNVSLRFLFFIFPYCVSHAYIFTITTNMNFPFLLSFFRFILDFSYNKQQRSNEITKKKFIYG